MVLNSAFQQILRNLQAFTLSRNITQGKRNKPLLAAAVRRTGRMELVLPVSSN